jgi:hypothetical protein
MHTPFSESEFHRIACDILYNLVVPLLIVIKFADYQYLRIRYITLTSGTIIVEDTC